MVLVRAVAVGTEVLVGVFAATGLEGDLCRAALLGVDPPRSSLVPWESMGLPCLAPLPSLEVCFVLQEERQLVWADWAIALSRVMMWMLWTVVSGQLKLFIPRCSSLN